MLWGAVRWGIGEIPCGAWIELLLRARWLRLGKVVRHHSLLRISSGRPYAEAA